MNRSSVHRLAKLAVWSTLVLVTFGGYVRGSGSGFGCKDRWPLCENGLVGGYLPRLESEMIVEWTHRWIALLVGILAIAIVVVAVRVRLDRRWVITPSVAVVVVIAIQAWLGRMVVKGDLARDLVTAHLFVSMVIVALFIVVAVATREAVGGPHLLERDWSRQLGIGAIAVLGVLLLGSAVHNVYVPGWPLVDGRLVPDLSVSSPLAIHWSHRLAGAAVFVYLIFLAWRCSHARRPNSEGVLVVGSLGLYSINIGLGLVHVLTQVSWSWVVALHLGVAALVWAGLVTATLLSFHDPR